MKKIKKHKWKLISLFILGICILLGNYKYVSLYSSSLIFDNNADIHISDYALLLGTPKYLPDGKVNNYYKNRIAATASLYENNKIQKIIISADTSNKYNENEVTFIKTDLTERGVNVEDIILDNYGNSTWNSITYLEKNLSTHTVVLISQEFHLERALFITQERGISAIGYKAKGKMSNRLWMREVLARVKMQIDIITN